MKLSPKPLIALMTVAAFVITPVIAQAGEKGKQKKAEMMMKKETKKTEMTATKEEKKAKKKAMTDDDL